MCRFARPRAELPPTDRPTDRPARASSSALAARRRRRREYARMSGMGVPLSAVVHKMILDELSDEIVQVV